MQHIRRIALALVFLLIAAACDPVTPIEQPEAWEFEGFDVLSYVPDDPVGLVYVFHGTGGSESFATKIEATDQLNELVSRGYAWVATESTDQSPLNKWDALDPSIETNADLARLERLHAHLIATTDVDAATPIFGIGMSNGARMVTLFGQIFAQNGYPVAAVAPFMGRAAVLVDLAGGLTIPAVWVIAENDTTTANADIVEDQAENAANGVPSVLYTKGEEPLLSARFTRIPEIDEAEAESITAALKATGSWDDDGNRLLPVDDVVERVEALRLPPSFGAAPGDVFDQVSAILAVHEFVGLYKTLVADFFDAQIAAP